MPRDVVVRAGRPEDLDWVIGELREFAKFYGTKRSLMGDEEYARWFVLDVMKNHLFLVAGKGGTELMGFIAGVVVPHTFNPNIKVLAETWWWVAKKWRGSGAGLMLLERFVKLGKERVDWITFSLEAQSPVNERVLTKRGFRSSERSFLLEV